MAALVTGNQATASVIERGLLDADAEVRRFAAAAAATDAQIDDRDASSTRLADQDARVRFEGLARVGTALPEDVVRAGPRGAEGSPIRTCVLQAIDQLGACLSGRPSRLRRSERAGRDAHNAPRDWHAPAHALVSLARIQPEDARKALPRFVQHPDLAGADVCRPRRGRAGLDRRAQHARPRPNDNVREAALRALIDLKRPEAVPPRSRR